jgi:hypothetical protein
MTCDRQIRLGSRATLSAALAAMAIATTLAAVPQVRAELASETVGKPPQTFEPVMGVWTVAQDGADKVIKVDGAAWKAAQDAPTRLLIDSARRLYGTTNEELMDNAKQFTQFPIAILRSVDAFSGGSIAVKFKTVSGDADRCSGILFNVKPNGDWLSVRYNDTEHNVAFWEFHNGVRRSIARGREGAVLAAPGDRDAWHELRLDVAGPKLTASIDGAQVLEFLMGSEPQPGRRGAPHPDLFPANNPVLRPPVSGRVGLWSKSDSTSLFKDYVVTHAR